MKIDTSVLNSPDEGIVETINGSKTKKIVGLIGQDYSLPKPEGMIIFTSTR